jgi:hypothetical protein
VVEEFMNLHDESEICFIQNDYDDSFNMARVSFYNIIAWPTVVGNGVTDTWPLDCFEGDLAAHAAIPSPLVLTISEQGAGQFTAHITAEEDVVDAAFFMVATLDEWVPSAEGMSHLPHHVKIHMTPPETGDAFTLLEGESVDISHSFTVQPDWDYSLMGVAAWVSRLGGTNPSPCPTGDIPIKNEVFQSRWVPATHVTSVENPTSGTIESRYRLSAAPNPFNPQTTVSFELPRAAMVSLQVYDLAGRLVSELMAGESLPAGRHAEAWDGRDRQGRQLSSGIYLCRLEAGGHSETMRMVLIR